MLLTAEDLQHVASRTLSHYDQHARSYWEGTRDHDVSQNVDALLQSIEGPPPFDLLDLGCGPGRDLRTFTALGHRATGLEGSAQLAALARTNSGCEVLEQNLLALKLPSRHFDGVFANAVLFASRPTFKLVLTYKTVSVHGSHS
jgi:SAM-dependent methyltransferase